MRTRGEVAGLMRAGESADSDVHAGRFRAQLLAGEPARGPVEVAERLLAIQGQDARGARLAIRARTAGLTAADVDRALTGERSLVITWLNRGTLHLVRAEDYWWLHSLVVRPQLHATVARVLSRAGLTPSEADKSVAVVEAALSGGPLTRFQLREKIASAGLPADDNIPLHVIALASLRGIAVRGPMIGAQHAYVHVRDWLGRPPPDLDRDVALAELARRYLAGHGPASDRDLAKWAGLPLGEARRGLTAIAALLRDRPDGLAELETAEPGEGLPPPKLLGAFDPALLGWADRNPILGGHQVIVTVNGLFRPFALVDGRAAATWAWTSGRVVMDRFAELPDHVETALAAEERDVQRFLVGHE
ncbi:MAG TPA: winged helix DNA-binding domain-containing protein [Streptosporangiaceae bacterium]|nr:winged helix DNA-binding domain-containing protein [Streptosporangiaceae bacterium]